MNTLAAVPAGRDVYVARQPIFDDRMRVLAYELLVAHDDADAGEEDATRWTATMFLDAFAEIGLEALTVDRQAWIPVTADVLVKLEPPPVRPDRGLLQLRLDAPPDEPLMAALRELSARGFDLAIDGLPSVAGPALELVSAVKISVAGIDEDALRGELALVHELRTLAVATDVRSHHSLRTCRALGFQGFQGQFLAEPDVVPGRRAPTNRLHALNAMAQLTDADLSFEDVERLIMRDVGLSHKLLRYANSALFSLQQRVESVREALMLLGARPVRRWAMLLALSGVRDQPHELIVTAMVRARMCELLRADSGHRDRAFTVGLFSVVNALLGVPMREALHDLPLSDEVKEAILHGAGPDGEALRAVVSWENGEFCRSSPGLTRPALSSAYREAVRWAHDITAADADADPAPAAGRR